MSNAHKLSHFTNLDWMVKIKIQVGYLCDNNENLD